MKRRSCGWFITGTDTGVGKTIVAGAMAARLRKRGIDVGVMKPVATGGAWIEGAHRLVSKDALFLSACAGVSDEWSLVNPVCFSQPTAPLTAARLSGEPIRFAAILRAYEALTARHDVVLVEGVGGWLVPLTAQLTVADLAARMQLPVLIVARPDLGTLNHTLLTIESVRRRALAPAGLVLNAPHAPRNDALGRLIARTNGKLLPELAAVPLIGRFPYLSSATPGIASQVRMAERLSRHLDARLLNPFVRGIRHRRARR